MAIDGQIERKMLDIILQIADKGNTAEVKKSKCGYIILEAHKKKYDIKI